MGSAAIERATMDQAANVQTSTTTMSSPSRYPLVFTGTGGEYFRIWIVNLLLTILTIGIYSAWAKVRKLQYFYRNTQLDGSVFDYHGNPLSILKGRLIALALILFYNFGFELNVAVGVVAAVVFGVALPWLLVQSQRFKLRYTSYRGLRFRFSGPIGEAYLIYGVPLALVLIAGLGFGLLAEEGEPNTAALFLLGGVYLLLLVLLPYLHWRIKRFQHANGWYGQARGRFHAGPRSFYWVYGQALLLLIAAGVLVAGVLYLTSLGRGSTDGAMVFVVLVFVAIYGALLGIGPFILARLQNLVWNNSLLGLIGFDSTVKARRFVWIAVSNLILIVLTLGFFTPFAAVRMYRYRVESVTVLSTTDLAGVVAGQSQEVGAVGEGAADLLDIDFAL
jgi:uncharacterized membrane protein YjgN (DUF898 family)